MSEMIYKIKNSRAAPVGANSHICQRQMCLQNH